MPIEIKELIIRATVRDMPEENTENGLTEETPGQANTSREEQIVNRCVEQVMDILRIQNER